MASVTTTGVLGFLDSVDEHSFAGQIKTLVLEEGTVIIHTTTIPTAVGLWTTL